jgi:arsenate reductase-like glutaredoxin family protein
MATMVAMIIVNQFHGAIKSHRKRRLEDHFVENDPRKRAVITETQSTLLESDKFDDASSNGPSSPSTASPDPLPQNELLQSEELNTSIDIVCKDEGIKGTNKCLTVKPKETPSYVSDAYSYFVSHVNKSEELKGLNFIGVISGLMKDNDPYIWHHAENLNNNNNNTTHDNTTHDNTTHDNTTHDNTTHDNTTHDNTTHDNTTHDNTTHDNTTHDNTTHDEGNQKELSYSVLRLDKFTKTNEHLKNNQDRWISLILHVSEMTEEEANEIFGDEPVFQEVLQMLKLDTLTSDKCQEYLHSEKIRRSEEEYNRSEFEKGWNTCFEIARALSREIGREISQKTRFEIGRRRDRNEAIVVKEIVGPIVDEHFDDQGFMKIGTEKHKPIIMDILERRQSSIPYDAIDFREKWSDEEIENFKENMIKTFENLLAKSSNLASENGLAKEKLVQKTFIKSTEQYNSTVEPPRQLICDSHQMSEIVKQQYILSH